MSDDMSHNNNYSAGILTISDRASIGEYEDKSGPLIKELLEAIGFKIAAYEIINDDIENIKDSLISLSNQNIDLIITSGGTGFSKRDNTPEATREILEKFTPGIERAIMNATAKITPMAYLSRGISGIRNNTLIINFPGSPKACRENFEAIRLFLVHGIDIMTGKSGH